MNNPFEIFSIPQGFSIDPEHVDIIYEKLSFENHPDRFSHEGQKQIALKNTLMINEAYGVLKKPISRLEVLFKVLNIDIPGKGGTTIQAPSILMENMELNESLKGSHPPHTDLRKHCEVVLRDISKRFESLKILSHEEAQHLYTRYVYFYKFLQKIEV